jgi:methylated-DNA-[protein]-cysteine S-methyltransferase
MTLFQEKVLFLTKKIPLGKITTYGEIARVLKTSSRAVGGALHKNPYLRQIPCHRVVKSDGSLGGYVSGERKKAALLRKEGIKIKNDKIMNFKDYFAKLQNLDQNKKLRIKKHHFN